MSSPAPLYLSLGSNLGDRKANLLEAISELETALGSPAERVSSFIETQSWGFDGLDFINCAALFMADKDPFEILHICKEIERKMGRTAPPEYSPSGQRIYKDRIIDIDILQYGDWRIDSPELSIPHPLMQERDFVMIPLREILDNNDYLCSTLKEEKTK